MSKLQSLIEDWKKDGNEDALQEYMNTEEYRKLTYFERNEGFITASKLKDYDNVPLFAMWRHIEGRTTEYDDKDYFTVGQAVDDHLTYGVEQFQKEYVPMEERVLDMGAAFQECNDRISKHQNNLNKDGSRSKVGINAEETQQKRLDMLMSIKDKTQLTMRQYEIVSDCVHEASQHPLFPKQAKKHHIIHLLFDKYPCKAELDDFEDDDAEFFTDYKTTASLITFDKYIKEGGLDIQMGFYYLLLNEKYLNEYRARLCVMDKFDYSRSHVWEMSVPYLKERTKNVRQLIVKWQDSLDTGVWMPPDTTTIEGLTKMWSSPFYKEYDKARSASPTIL